MSNSEQPLHYTVEECFYYPIKSCAGLSSNQLEVERHGPKGDREWMLIDDKLSFVSQRTCPSLSLVSPTLSDDFLTISSKDLSSVAINLNTSGEEFQANIWNDQVTVEEPSKEASEWFSNYLSKPIKLVKMGKNYHRPIDKKWTVDGATNSLSDGFPLLIANQTSLDSLNKKLQTPITMSHFRPNLVVKTSQPFEEDHWKSIKSNNLKLKVVKPCTRCIMICNDPTSGTRPNKEVLNTLGRIHKVNGKIIFGQNLIPLKQGTILKGEQLTISN